MNTNTQTHAHSTAHSPYLAPQPKQVPSPSKAHAKPQMPITAAAAATAAAASGHAQGTTIIAFKHVFILTLCMAASLALRAHISASGGTGMQSKVGSHNHAGWDFWTPPAIAMPTIMSPAAT